jgi:hypothetical protein
MKPCDALIHVDLRSAGILMFNYTKAIVRLYLKRSSCLTSYGLIRATDREKILRSFITALYF